MSNASVQCRALLQRFLTNDSGSAVAQYFVFTTLWSLCMAGVVYLTTPKVTVKLQAVSAAMSQLNR